MGSFPQILAECQPLQAATDDLVGDEVKSLISKSGSVAAFQWNRFGLKPVFGQAYVLN